MEIVREVEKIGGGAAVYLATPIESWGLEWAKVNNVTYACSVHTVCISVLMNHDCTAHPILPFSTITIQNFFQNIALKGYLTQR